MLSETRTQQVMGAIRRKITGRILQPSERLPSIRGLAATMNVSPSTVAEAYDRLTAEGLIYARRGAGFYVAQTAQPFDVTEVEPRLNREIDPFWVTRQSLDAEPHMAKPGCGWLPPDWMPLEELRRALRRVARADDALLVDYGSTRGSFALRRFLAGQFADEGLTTGPDDILLTASGTQAIDLICRLLLRPGDTVVVDDPCYFNFQALLRAHQVELVSVSFTKKGPDLERFEQVLKQYRPTLYITNSALHNPTGASLTPPVAHKLLKLAATHNLIVIEDDIFAAFESEPSVRLAVLDGLENVIRIGSFSKTLSASVRCGYIAAKKEWVEALIDLQVATNFGGPSPVTAELIYSVLSTGGYRRHMYGLRERLAQQRRVSAKKLEELGITPWLMPQGGFYLWCELPDGMDSADLARRALDGDVVLAPGNVFSVSQTMAGFMRFNVGQMSHPETLAPLHTFLRDAG
ncbi:putative HTH-type transcriptional regulator YdcR [Roseovarius albus]|uniref:Putative HTH-type transcriptional regulator YdcR n=1 Tax=Roseovarius albus TaxID=1247867 RepID=A0A1X7A7V2_9RHOB|nr:PLP-dependent aminotransferase family protein [Roseovarius albus]SLN72349.1 putative HTH-type transcriptional regulator YdcR [Roseovarius albus]